MTEEELKDYVTKVDWSYKQEDTISCRCGICFRSKTKLDMKLLKVISKDACPSCGSRQNFRGVASDREEM